MAIVNLTDDSFSGDGLRGQTAAAVQRAEQALAAGAEILDLGAESTRPGATVVAFEQELERLQVVLESVLGLGVPISVDTMKPAVMRAVLAQGVDIINDIQALRIPGALQAVAASQAAVCLMHMQGEPRTMQQAPTYEDVVLEVGSFLAERAAAAMAAGIARERIVLDPGFGFGKSVEHNFTLLRRLSALDQGFPLLVGLSRKSMLGAVTGRRVEDRLAASTAAAVLALMQGARILRVHDVAATRDALRVWEACSGVAAPT